MDENKTPAPVTHMAPVDWENAGDPVVKLFVGFDVEGYVEEYELAGDDGDYSPNEEEKTLIADAIHGVVFKIHEELRKLIPLQPASSGPSKEQIERAIEAYREGVYLTDEQVHASVTAIVRAALTPPPQTREETP